MLGCRKQLTVIQMLFRRQILCASNRRFHQAANLHNNRDMVLKCYSRLSTSACSLSNDFPTANPNPSHVRRRINSLKFDLKGVLIAAGRSDGNLSVYDMDEFSFKENRQSILKSYDVMDSNEERFRRLVQPILSIDTQADIDSMAWQPVENSTRVCCTFLSKSEVNIYDLETAHEDPVIAGANPFLRLMVAPHNARGPGQTDVCFTDPHSVVCLDKIGTLRLWDVRQPARTPTWVLPKAVPWNRSVERRNFCMTPSNDKTVFFCSGGSSVLSWDARNLVSPVMAATCQPASLKRWDTATAVPKTFWRAMKWEQTTPTICALETNPYCDRHCAVVFDAGFAGVCI